jgi:hypothetical protein
MSSGPGALQSILCWRFGFGQKEKVKVKVKVKEGRQEEGVAPWLKYVKI